MTVNQVYNQTIRPLSRKDKLAIARMIVNDFKHETSNDSDTFNDLKRLLPHIEHMSITDEHTIVSTK
jgi:hypothetical protein